MEMKNIDIEAILEVTPLLMNSEGALTVAGLDPSELLEEYGSPLFVFHEGTLLQRAEEFVRAFSDTRIPTDVIFAMKSNGIVAVLETIRRAIKKIDTTSLGEMATASAAGFKCGDMVLHGNAKSARELKYAVENDIGFIVADSIAELEHINSLAADQNKVCRVGVRINLELENYAVWNTSSKKSKFGVYLRELLDAASAIARLKNISMTCLHTHVGSQISDLELYLLAVEKIVTTARDLSNRGISIETINIGGGFPVRYRFGESGNADNIDTGGVDIYQWLKAILNAYTESLRSSGLDRIPTLATEPGRSIVAHSGVLLARVESVKERKEFNIVSLDAGCNTLTDCWTYDWYFQCIPISTGLVDVETRESMVVGPLCDSGDVLIPSCRLPVVKPGDLVAFLQVGAYQFEQQSNFNLRPRAAAVMVSDGKTELISDRYVVGS